MDGGDTASLPNTLDEAECQLAEVGAEPREVVADKGYHSNKTMTETEDRRLRTYVSEPNRGHRNWKRNRDAQKPTYANRRRIRRNRGKQLLRQRRERLERGFAHLLASGGLRRVHVRGQEEIRKRILNQAATFNLGLLMSKRFGFGTLRALQGLARGPSRPLGSRQHRSRHIFRHSSRHIGPFRPIPESSQAAKLSVGTSFLSPGRGSPSLTRRSGNPLLPRPASRPTASRHAA